MFEWKVEELKLRKEFQTIKINRTRIFNCEYRLTEAEKIAFVDAMQDGKLSYIVNLAEKFAQEKDTLPKDKYNTVRTGSLKAWLNRNDTVKLFDTRFDYGSVYLCGIKTHIQSINTKSGYWHYDNFVDEVFHAQLMDCMQQENHYFDTHDEYTVMKHKLLQKTEKYGTTFGVLITYSSNGDVKIRGEDVNGESRSRPITIEECEELLAKYAQVEQLITKLTDETHIVY